LFNRSDYAGYLGSTILPQALRHLQIHLQHRRAPRRVIDNCSDPDEQEALAAEAIDKKKNRLGLGANATGAGLVSWEDVGLDASAASSPHQGNAVDLAWNPPMAPDVVYSSDTGAVTANELDTISVRVGQYFEDTSVNPAGLPADLFVTLNDGGNQATVRAGAVALVPYPDDRTAAARLCPMRTIRIPLDAFTIANPSFDRTSIASVRLDLTARPTGHIFADDLEVSS